MFTLIKICPQDQVSNFIVNNGPPGVLGILGEWLFIFRELGSTVIIFRDLGEQAHSFVDLGSPANKQKNLTLYDKP